MKKVIIFTSNAAGGQPSVTSAITHSFEGEYSTVVTSIFSEVLSSLDPIHKKNVDKLYNWLLLKKWSWFTNAILLNAGIIYYRVRRRKIISLLLEHLKKEQPAAIISIIPIVNYEILQAAQELNIPFFLFSPDLDPSIYLNGIYNPSYQNFVLGLPFHDEQLEPILAKHQITESQVVFTGYPLRPQFTGKKDHALLRKQLSIPENKPVILILMGSLGADTLPAVIQQIYKLSTPAHLLICTGKAEHLKEKIEQIPCPQYISKKIIGFTQNIADLMAVSDLFVTKSGSVSVAEAVYMNLPMLLDATSEVLVWEKFNHEFITKNHWGCSLSNLNETSDKVSSLLLDRRHLNLMSNNITAFEKKNGSEAIKQIIDQLTAGRSSGVPLMVYIS